MTSYRLQFITPLFSKGSYDDQPEIRSPSIRGQLHWWFRALGGNHSEEKGIFGGVHGGLASSKIVVRVGEIRGKTGNCATLPHKLGGQASEKAAYLPGTAFDLNFTERLGGLTEPQRRSFYRTLEAWLMVGTLGLRATRAGGSFTWQPNTPDAVAMPTTPESYAKCLSQIFSASSLQVRLLKQSFASAEIARLCVSDTIGGREDPYGTSDLARLRDPLGKIHQGRKTSPLRFRIVRLCESHHIVATWDNRSVVTGNRPGDFDGIVRLLESRGKDIGTALKDSY